MCSYYPLKTLKFTPQLKITKTKALISTVLTKLVYVVIMFFCSLSYIIETTGKIYCNCLLFRGLSRCDVFKTVIRRNSIFGSTLNFIEVMRLQMYLIPRHLCIIFVVAPRMLIILSYLLPN